MGFAVNVRQFDAPLDVEMGDTILQTPMIPHREIECSEDFEVLEIVSPADFKTKIVDAPEGAVAAE